MDGGFQSQREHCSHPLRGKAPPPPPRSQTWPLRPPMLVPRWVDSAVPQLLGRLPVLPRGHVIALVQGSLGYI